MSSSSTGGQGRAGSSGAFVNAEGTQLALQLFVVCTALCRVHPFCYFSGFSAARTAARLEYLSGFHLAQVIHCIEVRFLRSKNQKYEKYVFLVQAQDNTTYKLCYTPEK